MPVLLSTAYFPPIEYFASMIGGLKRDISADRPAVVFMEACEHYQKQTWRNRCRFYGSEGPQILNYPIVHTAGLARDPITEVLVDWSTPWLPRHQRAIDTAYHTSAFFDYYRDELYAIMDRKEEKLFDFNASIMQFFLDKMGIPVRWTRTESYSADAPDGVVDLREVIHPKRNNDIMEHLGLTRKYFQVFSPKFGFVPGLSIMDLLFNEGPDAVSYLISVQGLQPFQNRSLFY